MSGALKGHANPGRADAWRRLRSWLEELAGAQDDGWRLWVSVDDAPLPVIEGWLMARAGLTVSTRIRTRTGVRLAEEWLAEAGQPVPAALDRVAWRAISWAVAGPDQPSPALVAELVWLAHEASLGEGVAPWLEELAAPWHGGALDLEAAAMRHLAAIRHPADLMRAGRQALARQGGARSDRLLVIGAGGGAEEVLLRTAASAGLQTVSLPTHLAALAEGGSPSRGEYLAAELARGACGSELTEMDLINAEDPAAEAAQVAAEVRRTLLAGMDPERIVVAVGQRAQLPAMARALTAAGVNPALSHSARSGWAGQRLMAGLAGLIQDRQRVDAWQLLADSGLSGSELPPLRGSRLMRRQGLQALAAAPQSPWSRLLQWPVSAAVDRHLERLFDLYQQIDLVTRVEELGETAITAWNQHLAVLRQVGETVGGCVVSSRRWAEMLAETLPALEPRQAPKGRRQVLLTTLEGALGRPSDLLCLSGLIAGSLPTAVTDDLPIPSHGRWQIWQDERLRRAAQLPEAILASAGGRVLVSTHQRDETGALVPPALWLERLRQLGLGASPRSTTHRPPEVASWQQAGRWLVLSAERARTTGRPLPVGWAGQMADLAERQLAYLAPSASGEEGLSRPLAQRLFRDSCTVSDLEERAKCPTRHLARAYQWPEPREGMTPRLWGEIMHGLLGRAASAEDLDWEKEVASQLDRLALPELDEPAERAFWQLRLTAAITILWPQVANELARSAFAVAASELSLGSGEVPTLSLRLPDGTSFTVRGRIDRLDHLGQEVRIVDYKSGSLSALAASRWAKLRAGTDLQLLAYGLAVRKAGLTPRALEYVALATPWENETEPADTWQTLARIGLYGLRPGLADDLGVHEGKALARADGSPSSRGGALAADDLERLLDLTEAELAQLAESVWQGEVAPDPVRIDRTLACSECALQPICRYEGSGRRQVAEFGRSDFLAWLQS